MSCTGTFAWLPLSILGGEKKKQKKNRKSFERQRHFQASVGKIWHIKLPSLSLLILYRATM